MKTWTPSAQYQKVADANREYYARTAQMYDASETCVTNKYIQNQLAADLEKIVTLIDRPAQEINVLDACGGTGNIALKLLRRGLKVSISDISAAQLAIFRQKCEEEDFSPQIKLGEIGELLMQDKVSYDLIVFSSALHHLENITEILRLSFDRLRPGGMLFTVFDPTATEKHKGITKAALRAEYVLFKIVSQTSDLSSALARHLRRRIRVLNRQAPIDKETLELTEDTFGVLAEYHVESGIDDIALVEELGQIGYQVVWHVRYPDGRYLLTRQLIGLLNDATQFKLLLRRPWV
jgi:2-polyprenyl-3-methyl-5-hydroxy-6-metoxy-1,4-benzoquinol methylase